MLALLVCACSVILCADRLNSLFFSKNACLYKLASGSLGGLATRNTLQQQLYVFNEHLVDEYEDEDDLLLLFLLFLSRLSGSYG